MAIDVNKPSSSEYSTKPTSQAPPPPCRDHQHNKNQTIPTITTQDQAFDSDTCDQDAAWPMSKWEILAAAMDAALFAPIEDTPGFTASAQDDFHKMTPEVEYDEQCYNYFDNDDDDDDEVIEIPNDMFDMPTMIKEPNPPVNDEFVPIPDGTFDQEPTIETVLETSATTVQQQLDTTITTMEDKLCTATTPNPMNDPKPITENQVTPMIIEDKFNHDKFTTSNDYYDNIDHEILRSTIDDDDYQAVPILPGMFDVDTTIETVLAISATTMTSDSPIKTQTPSKDLHVSSIPNNNTNKNKKKKKKKKATMKMTHMAARIKEEPNSSTNTKSNSTTATITENQVMPTIIEDKSNHDEFPVSN